MPPRCPAGGPNDLGDRPDSAPDVPSPTGLTGMPRLGTFPHTAVPDTLTRVTPALEPLRRIAAYGLCSDAPGRVLLVRAPAASGTPAVWSLPGGAPPCRRVPGGPGPGGRAGAEGVAGAGVATGPRGRLLLARVAEGYPGGGRWHLPGGGTEYGEQPGIALIRELEEETGQRGR